MFESKSIQVMTYSHLPSILTLFIILLSACNAPEDNASSSENIIAEPFEYALVLHGGAGNMNFQSMPEPYQSLFKNALDSALQLGLDVLK